MSDFSLMVDNIVEDLRDNVVTLGVDEDAIYRYDPASPEELIPAGHRCLAVWPVGEGAEAAEPLTLGAHQLNQVFRVLVWEDFQNPSRAVSDQEATKTFLDLHNAVRLRFYIQANQGRAGAFRVWYSGTRFPERPSQVRWFEMEITVATGIAFT